MDHDDPSGPTFALGGRAFTPGVKHRGFLALCVSQLFVEGGTDDPHRLYGPGIEAGYQFASRGGFTAMLGAGLGYAARNARRQERGGLDDRARPGLHLAPLTADHPR